MKKEEVSENIKNFKKDFMEDLISDKDLSFILNIKLNTLRAYRSINRDGIRDALSCVKIGGHAYFFKEEVLEFLNKRKYKND